MSDCPQAVFPTVPAPRPATGEGLIAPHVALTSIACVVYDWCLRSDRLAWSPNADAVFRLAAGPPPTSGEGFAALIDRDAAGRRVQALAGADRPDAAQGVPYRMQYALHAPRRAGAGQAWIEEIGRWFAGPDGHPDQAHGTMRLIDRRHGEEPGTRPRPDAAARAWDRAELLQALHTAIEGATRHRQGCAFLLAGIELAGDGMHGLAAGEEAIAVVAGRIRARMRGADVLGRLSDARLGIVLGTCEGVEMPAAAQRFLEAVAGAVVVTRAGLMPVRIAIGGVLAPRHARTAAQAMDRAEAALHDCRSTRAGFLAFSPNAAPGGRRGAGRPDDIVAALNDRRLALAFEPVLDAATLLPAFHDGRLVQRLPDGTIAPVPALTPADAAEGLAPLLDHRRLELAAEALSSHDRLAVRLATIPDPDWLAAQAVVLRHRRLAHRLILGIGEATIAADPAAAGRLLGSLRDQGVAVAIDGFGSGGLPLRTLRDLPVDMVRLDGAFVAAMAHSPDGRFLVRTLIDLARQLGLTTLAPWVPDEAAAAQLAAWGCDYLQGALVARAAPKPAAAATGVQALAG